jgi:hypothetical protein
MHIVVYENQEARFVLVLSDAMNFPAVPIKSPRNQIAIDNTRRCWKGVTKRFFHRKRTMNAMIETVLWAVIRIV